MNGKERLGDFVKHRFRFACIWLTLAVGSTAAQTFEVGGQGKSTPTDPQSSGTKQLGWGSSIEVARQARAAQDAISRSDYNAAVSYAEAAAKAAPQDPQVWFLLGYAARLAGRYQVSANAYQHGLQSQPASSTGLFGLAQTYVKMGRDEEARQITLKVVAANPKDNNAQQFAGELFLASDPKRALEFLQRSEAAQPSARAELLMARAYQKLGQPEESKKYLVRAKNRAPQDPDVLRALAGFYRESGQYDQAISSLQAVPSKNAGVLAELAYTYGLAGKNQEAADYYSKAAKASKGQVGLVLSAAQALVNLGQMDAAGKFLEEAQKTDPKNYRLHAISGQINAAGGRSAEAIQEYQLALDNLPEAPLEGALYPVQLRLNLYELYKQTNDEAAAKQQLDRAAVDLQKVPAGSVPQVELLRSRAVIELASGNLSAADADLKQALALAPNNLTSILNYAALLWKLDQKDAARGLFEKALELDNKNLQALASLGHLARENGDTAAAEKYFARAAKLHPNDAAGYLGLADVYAAKRDFPAALTNYEAAYKRSAHNPLIVAGGANAALEAHKLDLAKTWLDRAAGPMNDDPQVMRERERYLTWKGEYAESAKLGEKVLEKLPRDPQAPVYLAYDYYYLGRYREALDLATKYDAILPNNKDLALIQGYVHARNHQLPEAAADFSRAVQADPKMATGYANRGYVYNDLKKPKLAVQDFQAALKLRPDYPEAHLGLAYAYLQVHRPKNALEQLNIAEKTLGKSREMHLARAEAYRQGQQFQLAEQQYRAALALKANDLPTQLALADTLYRLRRYADAIEALKAASGLAPEDAVIYARQAQIYARQHDAPNTLRAIETADKYGKTDPEIQMAGGDALLTLGERDRAMERFSLALEGPSERRMGVRLAIAQVFVQEQRWDDARRQIGLALSEARVEDALVTPDDLVETANLLARHA